MCESTSLSAHYCDTTFFAAVNHELRVRLQSIVGHLELLSSDDVPVLAERVNLVRQAAAGLGRTLDDALDVCRDRSTYFTLCIAAFDIRSRIDDEVRLLAPLTHGKQVALTVRVDPAVPLWLAGDADRVMLIVRNLLANAIKFTQYGRVAISVQYLRCINHRVSLRVSVEDTGIGMTEQEQARLFRPFAQANAHIASRFGGSGLGLWLSRQWAEQMKGVLSVRSQPGVGSQFCFDVTLAEAQPPRSSQWAPTPEAALRTSCPLDGALVPRLPAPSAVRRLRNICILVVDDHPMNRRLLAEQLMAVGCQVTVAKNAATALSAATQEIFDLILTDIRLGDEDGYALASALRQLANRRDDIPPSIWAVTGDDIDRRKCRLAGIELALRKPVGLKQLATLLANHQEDADALAHQPQAMDRRSMHLSDDVAMDEACLERSTMFAADSTAFAIMRRATQADAAALRKACRHRQPRTVMQVLHRMHGAFAIFGASALAQRCLKVRRVVEEAGGRAARRACAQLLREVGAMFGESIKDSGTQPGNGTSSLRWQTNAKRDDQI